MEMRGHSGYCCGINVLYGFDNETITSLDAALRRWDTNNRGNTRRVIEVVLSERQVRGTAVRGRNNHNVRQEVIDAGGWPTILAARGFRLVNRFNNSNSGQNCYIFHRLPEPEHFLSLADADLPFEWNGQAIEHNVPDVPRVNMADVRGGGRVARNTPEGTVVQYVGTGARRGQTGRLCYVANGGWDRNALAVVEFNADGARERLALDNFRLFTGPGNIPIPNIPIPQQNQEVRVIRSDYSNHFRRNGRSQKMFETFAAAREDAPRCQQIDRRETMSDGTVRWIENVTR